MTDQRNPDTIAAIATPPGRGAIGIVRVSGPDVPHIAAGLLGHLPVPRHAGLAAIRDADGSVIDQCIALYFAAPASYSGEHLLELHCHGGPVVLGEVLRRLLQLGCRAARPGEFSERAFVNGKLDVAQAEAVADLIDASTGAAARAAVRSLQGEFSARIADLQHQLTGLRAWVEAAIDFPDEDVEWLEAGALAARLAPLLGAFDALAAAARQGTVLREGLAVVIAGLPNAGKSSLMNALAGSDVAIVTAVPGTTRDVLRERIEIDGMPIHLVDTAGLRSAADPVEAEGVRRAGHEIGRADRLLYVVDATGATACAAAAGAAAELTAELSALPPGIPVTLVFNKIDVPGADGATDLAADPVRIALSAKTGQGMDALRDHLKTIAGYVGSDAGAISARRRHLDALARARAHVDRAADALLRDAAPELFAEDLRLAQVALGEITGEFTSDDLLGRIFADFCIGK